MSFYRIIRDNLDLRMTTMDLRVRPEPTQVKHTTRCGQQTIIRKYQPRVEVYKGLIH
jgi:hypothetical protein